MIIPWKRVVGVWWSFFWRATLLGLAGGVVLGFLGGVLAAVSGDASRAPLYGTVGGYVAGLALSVPALKWALEKHLMSLGELASAPSSGLDRTV